MTWYVRKVQENALTFCFAYFLEQVGTRDLWDSDVIRDGGIRCCLQVLWIPFGGGVMRCPYLSNMHTAEVRGE